MFTTGVTLKWHLVIYYIVTRSNNPFSNIVVHRRNVTYSTFPFKLLPYVGYKATFFSASFIERGHMCNLHAYYNYTIVLHSTVSLIALLLSFTHSQKKKQLSARPRKISGRWFLLLKGEHRLSLRHRNVISTSLPPPLLHTAV